MSLFALDIVSPPSDDLRAAVAEAVAAAHAAAGEAATFDPEAWALDMTALGFCREVSLHDDVPIDQVWHYACNLTLDKVRWLDSPDGWAALATDFASWIGHEGSDYRPQVH